MKFRDFPCILEMTRVAGMVCVVLTSFVAFLMCIGIHDQNQNGRRLGVVDNSDPKTIFMKNKPRRNPLEFVHITKTGGTAIERAAAKAVSDPY